MTCLDTAPTSEIHRWLVFTRTLTQVPGLVLVPMWMRAQSWFWRLLSWILLDL